MLLCIGFLIDQGLDLQVIKLCWQMWQVYGEGVYFFNQGCMIISIEMCYGYMWLFNLISDCLMVYLYIVLVGDYDNKVIGQWFVLGVGLGINFCYWFWELYYVVLVSWLDLIVQYCLLLMYVD